jgi:hypothetical protein
VQLGYQESQKVLCLWDVVVLEKYLSMEGAVIAQSV